MHTIHPVFRFLIFVAISAMLWLLFLSMRGYLELDKLFNNRDNTR